MKILKIAAFLSFLAALPCEAQTTRSGMLGYNTSTFTNCGTNCITGTQLNIWNSTLVNSAGFLQDSNNWTGRNVFNNTLQGAINLAPSAPPSTPANGDLWATPTGLFVEIGGISYALLGGGLSPPSMVVRGGVYAQSSYIDATGLGSAANVSAGAGVATALATSINASGGFITSPAANSNLAPMAAGTIKGNNLGSTGNALDLTATQVKTLLGIGAGTTVANAAGSITATTGAISASSSTLTLASAIDFVNNQGIRINGAGATFSLTAPAGLAVTPNGVTGATTYTYTVACLDNNGGVGEALTAVSITNGNNSGLSPANYNAITWSNPGSCPVFAVYGHTAGALTLLAITPGASWNDYGVANITNVDYGTINTWGRPDWLPAAPQTSAALNDYLLTTITSGGGTTTLTLANSASNVVVSANVTHDDTVAINAAIAACGSSGCQIDFAPGHYPITSTINLGNGGETSITPSSVSGILLNGRGARIAPNGINTQLFNVSLEYQGYGNALQINGPTSGMGTNNIGINMVTGSTSSFGLYSKCGAYGQFRGLTILNAPSAAIREESGNLSANHCGEQYNSFTDTYIYLPPFAYSATGISIASAGSYSNPNDVYQSLYINTLIQPTNYNSAQTCIYAGASDTMVFIKTTCQPINAGNPSHIVTALLFDYANGASAAWPSGYGFYYTEFWKNTVTNNGTPITTVPWYNMFYGFSMENGASLPNITNVYASNGPLVVAGSPPITSGACSPGAATGSGVSGTFTLGATCTGATVTLAFLTAAPTGWFCTGNNLGTAVLVPAQSAGINSSNLYIANGAAGNVISYQCTPR